MCWLFSSSGARSAGRSALLCLCLRNRLRPSGGHKQSQPPGAFGAQRTRTKGRNGCVGFEYTAEPTSRSLPSYGLDLPSAPSSG
jgi:hypothetical protein